MNQKMFLVAVLATSCAVLGYDAERQMAFQDQLTFIAVSKNAMAHKNRENWAFYKEAQKMARHMLGDEYHFIKQQIKAAISKIIESQEFIDYNNYCVDFHTELLIEKNIKVKYLPTIRPDHMLAKKINDVLSATIP